MVYSLWFCVELGKIWWQYTLITKGKTRYMSKQSLIKVNQKAEITQKRKKFSNFFKLKRKKATYFINFVQNIAVVNGVESLDKVV